MLQYLRSRNASFLVYVTHKNDGNSLGFCLCDKGHRNFLDVGNAAWGRGDLVGIHGLYRVRDDHVRFDLFCLGKNPFNIGFGENIKPIPLNLQAFGSQLQLSAGFFTRNVKYGFVQTKSIANLQ